MHIRIKAVPSSLLPSGVPATAVVRRTDDGEGVAVLYCDERAPESARDICERTLRWLFGE